MLRITVWFDPADPSAWLPFERLPEALVGHSHVVTYRPVLQAALRMPAVVDRDSAPLLQLLLACRADGLPNRCQCETVLRHVQQHGPAVDRTSAGWAALTAQLPPAGDLPAAAVAQVADDHANAARAAGVRALPVLAVVAADAAVRTFDGAGALERLAAWLAGGKR